LLVVCFPLLTIASSRVRYLKLKPLGATDHRVSDLLAARLGGFSFDGTTIRRDLETEPDDPPATAPSDV
jgi:hypothetical protein